MTTDPVDRLLEQYAAAFRSGKPDPTGFLDQAEGEDRAELETMIEVFLLRSGPREWDPEAFAASPARELADRIAEDLIVPPGGWRELLPSLRMRRRLKREKVDAELAAALDAENDDEAGKVADYYHDMERGNLPAGGVSDKVLDSLARIYGTTTRVLRRAGEATGRSDQPGVVYARSPWEGGASFSLASEDREAFSRVKGKPDRIDRLFVDVERSGDGR